MIPPDVAVVEARELADCGNYDAALSSNEESGGRGMFVASTWLDRDLESALVRDHYKTLSDLGLTFRLSLRETCLLMLLFLDLTLPY